MNDIELPWSFYNMHGLEFNGQISLKAGLYYADHITAVSPTYAREITEPQYAYGMEGCCASAIMKVGCREFSTALTTVSGARKRSAAADALRSRHAGGEGGEQASAADCHGPEGR